MRKLIASDPETQSADIVTQNLSQLKSLFPEAFVEGKIQFDVLRQLMGESVEESDEKFGLTWHGKRRARQMALKPSASTLLPHPTESVDWATTQNLMIEGDNLEVLKLLQKSYSSGVKLIYIDPPYNTGKDFVYPDNFHDSIANYLELTGQVEGGNRISSNTEASGRFHTAWLNMMYPRLKLAKSLLTSDGAVLVSIGDKEIANLLSIMNEIYGEENQIGIFTWKSRAKPTNAGDAKYRPQKVAEYVVAYGTRPADESLLNVVSSKVRAYPNADSDGKFRTVSILTSNRGTFRRETMRFTSNGYTPDEDSRWKAGKTIIDDLFSRNRVVLNEEGIPAEKKYEHEERDPLYPIYCFMDPEISGTAEAGKSEVNELLGNQHGVDTIKPVQLLKYFISTFTNDGDLIVDFFAGTGTTAQAVMEANQENNGSRRFILVQLPHPLSVNNKEEVTSAEFCDSIGKPRLLSEITKERIRRAAAKVRDINPLFTGDYGFRVFKLATSNIRAWNPDHENLAQSLLDHHEHIVGGRTEADIVYELLLKLGVDLCVPIESRDIVGKTVGAVAGGVLMLCLSEQIFTNEVELLAAGIVSWHKELAPAGDSTVVFRDSAFVDDVAKTNMAAILAQNGLDNVRSL